MKKLNFWLLGSLFVGAFALSACSSSDSEGGGSGSSVPFNPDKMKFATVSGVVHNGGSWGNSPLAGVTVTSGDQVVTSDLNGFFKFDKVKVQNGRALVKFSKEGYASVVRSISYESGSTVRLDANLLPAQEKIVSSTSPSSITVGDRWSGEVIIDFEGGFTANGTNYTGAVTANAVYLDPDNGDFAEQMPGDLSAVRADESAAQLVSWGMVAVDLTGDQGQELELANGKKATLRFPIPDKFKNETAPESIPLWSFNEDTGLWVEEGVATLNGEYYEGEVSHFSWHNLDSPELTAHLEVTVKDSKGKLLSNVPIDIDGQRTFYTDSKGQMKCDIPSRTKLYVRVPSEAYGNYADYGSVEEFKQEIKVGGDETKKMDIVIPASAPRIYGTVTNTGGSNVCALYISYGWDVTGEVMSDVNGYYSIFGPANYTGAAVLFARFADGSLVKKTITIGTEDLNVDLQATVASSSGTGMFTVVNKEIGLNMNYPLPSAEDGGLWTATLENGNLSLWGDKSLAEDTTPMPEGLNEEERWMWEEQHMQGGRESFHFSVSDYSASKTEYDNVMFEYRLEAGPHFALTVQNAKATITQSNGIYSIKMKNVKGYFSDQMSGIEDQTPVTANIEFSAKTK